MTNFYLAMYNFKIKINKGEYLELGKIPVDDKYRKNKDSKYISFNDICKIIFKDGDFVSDALKVCKLQKSEDPFFHAKLGLAEYGNKRGLHDGENDIEKEPLDELDKVLEPFFFMFCTPTEDNNENGFFVIEKKKSKPIINEFKKMLNNKLREINDEIRVEFLPHTPNELDDVVNDGIVNEYIFTVYENESDNFEEENLSTIKIMMPALKRVHPNEVNKKTVLNRLKNFLRDINPDNKFKMKVNHSDNQEATLDVDDIFNHNALYLKINSEITTVKDNPTYSSMVEVAEKYIKSNFKYYIDKENKSKLEK